MRRFVTNRWWAFLLTLGLLLAGTAAFSWPGPGNEMEPMVIGDGGGGTGGDPDGTVGPGLRPPMRGRVLPGRESFAATPVGDGGPVLRVWSWRIQVVLRSLFSRFYWR